jgi:hypothetical protein
MDDDEILRFEQQYDEAYWLEQEEIERKRDAELDCPCGEPLIPDPFVTERGISIAYNCPQHGLISLLADPFEGLR